MTAFSRSSRSKTTPCLILLLALCAGPLAAPPRMAQAQTQADYQRLVQINNRYLQAKAKGDWAKAAAIGEEMRDYSRRRNLGLSLEMAAVDQIALARLNEGKYDVALELYHEVVDKLPQVRPINELQRQSNFVVYFNGLNGIARTLHLLERYDEALEWFDHAIAFTREVGLTAEEATARIDTTRILMERNQYNEAIEVLNKAIPILRAAAAKERPRDNHNVMYSNALQSLGQAYMALGRYDLAEPRMREALDVSVRTYGWYHNFTATTLSTLGNLYQLQNRDAEAERMLRLALKAYEASVGRNNPQSARVMNNLARLLEYTGRPEEGEKLAREALDVKRQFYGPRHSETGTSLLNLGNILTDQNRLDEAIPLLQEAISIRTEVYGEMHADTAECLQILASVYWQQNKAEQALELLDRALEVHRQNPFSPRQASSLYVMRANTLYKLDRLDDAIAEMQNGLAQAEIQRAYTSGAERERATFFADFASYYYGAIGFHAQAGNVEEMFRLIESLKARSFLDELQLAKVDPMEGVPAAQRQALEQEGQSLRRQLSQSQAAYDALPDPGAKPSQQQIEQRRAAAQAILEAREALYEHLVRVRAASPTYREVVAAQSAETSIADIQASLKEGEVLLNYSVSWSQTYVIVVRRDDVYFESLAMTDDDARVLGVEPGNLVIDDLPTLLLSEEGVLAALSSPEELGQGTKDKLAALWRTLLPERERKALLAGEVTQLTVLPASGLSLLPFEALIVENGDEPQYLLDVGPPISYAPSATVLSSLRNRNVGEATAAEPVLALGDPAYPQSGPAPEDVASRELAKVDIDYQFRAGLSPLPASGKEASWVKQNFDKIGMTTLKLVGSEATEGAVRRLIGGRQIVHLACHGMADESYGNLFGTLALSPGRAGDPNDDGFLSMSEIYELDLDACELAILSACETNYGPQQQGEGTWALSRGFLVAGARRVVASNWVVSDEAGATLVSYFTDYLSRQGSDAGQRDHASALRDAKRLVRKNPRWSHPFYWSSLVLVGPH